MASYRQIDTNLRVLAVNLEPQLLASTLADALNHLLNCEVGLSALEAQFKNEDVGANDLLSSVPPFTQGSSRT
jgi:hypothetical protein